MNPLIVSDYIPKGVRNKPLFVEVARLLQEVVDQWQIDIVPIGQKYDSLSATTLVLDESGYTLYSKLLQSLPSIQNSPQGLSEVRSMFPLIQAMKGTKEGLQRALQILQLSATIDDRLATDPVTGLKIPDMTFDLYLKIDLQNSTNVTMGNIRDFCSSYVQPLLKRIIVSLNAIPMDVPLAIKTYVKNTNQVMHASATIANTSNLTLRVTTPQDVALALRAVTTTNTRVHTTANM